MSSAPVLSPRVNAPVCVALSGGMDSMALLHALAEDADVRANGLRALHVHHGMQRDADDWAAHCLRACEALGVDITVEQVDVRGDSGLGREGAAREARQAAFARQLLDGEHLALAHHQDDQAETFLLRALRASGVDGLGAMAPLRPLAHGWLWRPWLDVPRAAIATFARSRGLGWIEDPTNVDTSLDRVFLRRDVLPLLRARWPHADDALATSARHARAAAMLLVDDDRRLLSTCAVERADTLSIAALKALSPMRRARVLRAWVDTLGFPSIPAATAARVDTELLDARPDSDARVEWRDASIRSWGGVLRASRDASAIAADVDIGWDGTSPVGIPGGGQIALDPPHVLPPGVRIRAREGGERIRLPGRAHHHALKHVLQELRVPPWTRERLPLLVRDDEVLAAGDLALSGDLVDLLARYGARLVWSRPPGA